MRRVIEELREEGYSLFEIIGTFLAFVSFIILYGSMGTLELTGHMTGTSIGLAVFSILYIGIFTLIKVLKEV